MLQDTSLIQAVSRIHQRSERQDIGKLRETFVDIGVLPQLDNQNHQIVYGRRGTGKTHIFRILGANLTQDKHNAVVYIDARTLGSTSQFSDPNISLQSRCLSLFRDILNEIHYILLEYVVLHEKNEALAPLDALADTITTPSTIYEEEQRTTHESIGSNSNSSLNVQAGFNKAHLEIGFQHNDAIASAVSATYKAVTMDKIIFPTLSRFLSSVLELADAQLYLLLDEWSSLPADIQPYLAEFLKRGVLPLKRAVVKIASLEYRSYFRLPTQNPIVGFEVGADISTGIDLDDYYVFDRNPTRITNAYASMLLLHLTTGLPDGYLVSTYNVSNGTALASRLFTQRPVFQELARACEGVVRDLINIFTKAYFHSQRRGRDSIDRKAVIEAARQWFEQDKAQHLSDDSQRVLRLIVDDVIGKKNARSFLIPKELERHPVIQKLHDARVLHLMQRGYADKDNPGVRYNIYTLDYGTYVDLIGTSRQPVIELLEALEDGEKSIDGLIYVVPFDDKRSIRRIVLREEILS
jgi:hypothetical protein